MALAPGCFLSGLLFAVVSPGPNFAEFQKTRAGGPLGKFDIARLHGHCFKRRGGLAAKCFPCCGSPWQIGT